MTALAIARFPVAPERPDVSIARLGPSHPKMQLIVEGGQVFTVQYAPRDSVLDGVAPTFASVDRGGRRPLLLEAGGTLETLSYDLILGYRDPQASIEQLLGDLYAIAKSGKRLQVKLDPTAGRHTWRITQFSQNIIARQHGTNHATRAVCTVQMTEVSDPVREVGPLSGGHSGGGSSGGGTRPIKNPTHYVVKKGDTLQSIAKHFYGKTSYWRKIADLNKIRDPKKLKVGQKLKLPPLPMVIQQIPISGPR
jgi:hypothetical protein